MRTGYFAPASELTPLFHTWSLAIEEQFYILFPVLFVFFFKAQQACRCHCCRGLFAASLFIAQMGGNFEPSHSPTHTGWSWQSQSSWVF
jgi:peptidoglycan/LPS O-acetylase OafA/YrhL